MDRGGQRLRAQQIGGTQLHRCGAEHERSSDSPSVGQSPRGDHRNTDSVNDSWQQRHRPGLRFDIGRQEHPPVAAGLGALGDHHVAAVLLEPDRLSTDRRRRHHDRTGPTDTLHELRSRQAEVEADDLGATPLHDPAGLVVERTARRPSRRAGPIDPELGVVARQRGSPSLQLGGRHLRELMTEEVDVQRSVRGPSELVDLLSELRARQHRRRQGTQAAGLRDRDRQRDPTRPRHRGLHDGDLDAQPGAIVHTDSHVDTLRNEPGVTDPAGSRTPLLAPRPLRRPRAPRQPS